MKFQWLKDDLKGNHLLCLEGHRSLFFRGMLCAKENGRRFWQPFPKGEPQEVYGDLESAKRCCEAMVQASVTG